MSETPSLSYSRIAWRVAQGAVYLFLGATVLFFALTRTEAGRDVLRVQVQSAFNERFEGSLQIGRLQGTLLNDLIATDVTLRDREGEIVATVDSLHTEPRWPDLLTANLSVQSLTLIRPHLRLHRRADSTWNLQTALSRRAPPANSPPRRNLAVSEIVVREGRITTTRAGAPPAPVQARWAFDYTRSTLRNLDLEAAVEWTDEDRRVALTSLRFQLPDHNLSLDSTQVRIARERGRWLLEDAALRLGNTRLQAEGTLQPAPSDSGQAVADFRLGPSQLDYDELRRLVPRLPLRDVTTVEGRMGGSLDRLVVNQLTVAHGRSALRVEGTAFGLPDSLNVEAQLLKSDVTAADVREVWPSAPLDRVSVPGPVQLGATVDGIVQWQDRSTTDFDVDGTLSAVGRPGAVRGSLSVQRSGSAPLRYSGSLRTDSLNLAGITGRPRLTSRLTGRTTFSGRGTRLRTLTGETNVRLSAGQLAGRSFAAADLQLTVDGRSAQTRLVVEQPTGGALNLRGEVDATGPTPLYTLASSVQDFDLNGAYSRLPTTRLNATLTTQGRGNSWQSLAGTAELTVDQSQVERADSTTLLPPHDMTVEVAAADADAPRLQLTGTLASATIEGNRLGPPLWASGRLWITSLRRALNRELTPVSQPDPDTASTPLVPPSIRSQTEAALADVERPVQLRGNLAVHRMDLLRRWWPGAPFQADSLRAQTTLTVSPDTLHAEGTVAADRLQREDRRLRNLRTTYRLSGPHQSNLLSALTAEVSVQADTLQVGARAVTAPSVSLSIDRGTGTLRSRAGGFGKTGPFDLRSDVALRSGQVDLTIRDLYVGAGQHAWLSTSNSLVSLHTNAVVFDDVTLESQRPLTASTQRIQLQGTLSPASSDTLHAEMSDVLLYPIMQLTGLSRPLGGRLNGNIAIAGGLSQPQVRGAFDVHRLSFDRRVLGTLQVQSRLAPTSSDLLIDAALVPTAPSLDSLAGPPLVPRGPQTLEENRLQLSGRVRLPGWSAAGQPDGDQLDVNVTVDRADLFFFKYIFDENLAKARGYTAGTIHIGGRFRRPIFDAEMQIQDARFTLPKFGLAYSASGPVEVDREGIHLRDLNVTDASGTATVGGSILFNEYKYFSFDLSAELDELTIIDVDDAQDLPFYGEIHASGPASLTGPLSNATLRSEAARTTPDSELFIPVSEGGIDQGSGFIIFADSTGRIPDLDDLTQRDNILADRPAGEPSFIEGLEIDINVIAPEESTVNLVFDKVVGDVVTAVGSGRVQLQRQGGEFFVYGNFNVTDGTYLFTAGEVFVRRFNISSGTLTWDGPPTNAQLDIQAEYRTRASTAGLPGERTEGRIPVNVLLDIGGRVATPRVDLSLARVRDERDNFLGTEALDAILNQPDRTTEYATSVLLTNTFLLTTESFTQGQGPRSDGTSGGSLATAGNQLAFNSVSQLVASQLNRYLGAALPNVDLNLGLQGEDPNDLDVIYGVALRLLNERLVIRGEGVYTGNDPDQQQAQGPQGEFVVEVRLSNRVSVEAFYRRTGDELTQNRTLTSSTGAGLSYQTEFATWRELFDRVFGWLMPDDAPPEEQTEPEPVPVARGNDETDSEADNNDNPDP